MPRHNSTPLDVVAALVRRRAGEHNEVLLTQRRPGRHLGLSWEFPGGKVEQGESDAVALMREMREELGVDVVVGTMCFETRHSYGSRDMHLRVYRCRIVSGKPRALDVNDMAWEREDRLLDREFLPADMPLVRGIVAGLVAYDIDDDDDDDEPAVVAQVVGRVELAD